MTNKEESRQTPEHFLSLIRQKQRGRLKIYLGFAAGVGKTYEMLQEAHRLRRLNVDVVIGIVETHGREETAALIGELEQVPRRKMEYRGVVLDELDVEGLLARHPGVALLMSWPIPMRPEAEITNVIRMSKNYCVPASTS